MSFSAGVYTLPTPALVPGQIVSSSENNTVRNDMAASFNLTWLRNGTAAATANIPMGSFKLTGLGAATTNGDALSYGAAAVVTTLTSTSLTATRVPYAGTGGLLQDASTFTFDGTTLTAGGFTTSGAISAGTITASGSITVSGGTANGVAYLNGSKVLTTGSALTFDGANLGLNTATPTSGRLVIAQSNSVQPAISLPTDESTIQGPYANTQIKMGGYLVLNGTTASAFNVGGSEQMRLTSTGLGIGTSSPSYKLAASANTADGTTGYAASFYASKGATGDSFLLIGGKRSDSLGSGVLTILDARSGFGNGAFGFYTEGSERMRLDSSGNLGLGVTPSAWISNWKTLQIGGGSSLTSRSDNYSVILGHNWFINSSGQELYIGSNYATRYQQVDGKHIWSTAPSGTAGNAITFTQAMTLTANGGLCVGTTTDPGAGNVNIANGGFYGWGGLDCLIGGTSAASGYIYFRTGATERMRIDSSGNVGIGTSSPSIYGAQIVSFKSTGSFGYLGHSNSGTFPKVSAISLGSDAVGFNYTTSGASQYVYGSAQIAALQSASSNATTDMAFYTTSGGSVTERMRIDSSGNVGIGTTDTSTQKLFVNNSVAGQAVARFYGNYAGSGTVPLSIWARTGGAVESIIQYNDAATAIQFGTTTGHPLGFLTSGTERMRIDSSGGLRVGTTAQLEYGASTERLTVDCVGGTAAVFRATGNTYPAIVVRQDYGSGTQTYLYFKYNGTVTGNVESNGTSTSYNTSSDYRLKENIQPMQNALAVVQQLNPVTYNWKADGSDGQGFIAHELQAVVPDCVTGEKDAVDEEGKPVYQGIDTSFLVATLTAAIQELKAELDATKAEVAALKGN